MPFIVSYNPDSESYDVIQKSPFKWMKSFTYEEDAFNYAKKLEPLRKIDPGVIDSALETHHHQVEILKLILKLNR